MTTTTKNTTTPSTLPRSTRRRGLLRFIAAVGVGVTGTIISINAWSASAAPGDTDTTYVPTAGCRLVDTRPGADNIGERATPLGPGDTHTIAVRGANGECTGPLAIPEDATGVALNATAVGATTSSNIRIYPANLSEPPLLSNLNVTSGASPTPNKVDVQLSPDGAITAYNFRGNVHLVLDVVGYYTKTSLAEIDQRLARLEAGGGGADNAVLERLDELEQRATTQAATIQRNADEIGDLDKAKPFVMTNTRSAVSLSATPLRIVSVQITAPVDGHVTATTANVVSGVGIASCSITTGNDLDSNYTQANTSPPAGVNLAQLAGTRRFAIAAGETLDVKLLCTERPLSSGGSAGLSVLDAVITAIFTPTAS